MPFRDDRAAALIDAETLRRENAALAQVNEKLRAELARKPVEAHLKVPYLAWHASFWLVGLIVVAALLVLDGVIVFLDAALR
jgi:hypothetical protein